MPPTGPGPAVMILRLPVLDTGAKPMPYCSKCGTQIGEDSKFCPSCGTAVGAAPKKGEKDEKNEKDEKDEKSEKQEKSEKGEKEESTSGRIVGGLIVIILGVLLLLQDRGYIYSEDFWAYLLFGIGSVMLLLALMRSTSAFKGPRTAPLIGGLVLCAVGLGGVIGIEHWWAYIIVAVGIAMVVFGLSETKKNPRPP